jgi:chromosome segregation ATPase
VAKSANDQIRELITDVRVLEAGNESARAQLAELKTTAQKRQSEVGELRNEIVELRLALAEARNETALLRRQFEDHLAQYQEADRRRWGLINVLIGALLSVVSGLIGALVRK